jgi:hypothetical protein
MPDPDVFRSRIQQKKSRGKKVVLRVLVETYLIFSTGKKKI